MADDATFGDLLRQFRLAAGLTQEALAERAGVSSDAVSTLERGARQAPRKETVDLLACALRLGPADRERLAAAAPHGRGSAAAPGATPAEAAPLPVSLSIVKPRWDPHSKRPDLR
jgi:transcriptional regulator with XRE-family HTH domain